MFYAVLLGSCITAPVAHEKLDIVDVEIGDDIYRLEVAHTDEQRQRGLSSRSSLDIDEGMLFLFDEAQRVSFWMRDTILELSLAWIDEEGRIYEVVDLVPMSLELVTSPVKVIAAIELPQGSFSRSEALILDPIIIDQCSLEKTTVLFPEMMTRCSR